MAVKPGDQKQNQEIEHPVDQPPEESAVADPLPGQEASRQTGDDIDGIDSRCHLGLRKLQLVEGQAQDQEQDPGQQVGDKQGTK